MAQSSSSQWKDTDKKTEIIECSCGKTYSSKRALCAHMKHIHGRNAPGQNKLSDSHKKVRMKASEPIEMQQHRKTIEQELKNDPIPELLAFVQGVQVSKNREIRQIYRNEPVFKLIMNDKGKPSKPKFLKGDKIHSMKMGEGIVQFFNQIQRRMQDKNVYDQIVILVVLLTQHIIEQTEDQNVLRLGTIGLMPQFVNYFMIHDYLKPVERLKLQKIWIFQDQNAFRILNFFFKWMLYQKLTLTKVEVNQKYFHPNQSESHNNHSQQDNLGSLQYAQGQCGDSKESEKCNSSNQEHYIQSQSSQSEQNVSEDHLIQIQAPQEKHNKFQSSQFIKQGNFQEYQAQ